MTLSLIVAVSDNGVIGCAGKIPWHLPEDLRRFKARTMGHTVVMGRVTAEDILRRLGGPLPHRRNVVLTANPDWTHKGFEVVHAWKDVEVPRETDDEIFVIGGANVYTHALSLADRLYVTFVHCSCEGDAFFPAIDTARWKMVSKEEFPPDGKNSHGMTFAIFDRRQFVDVAHSRSDEQRAVMEGILANGHCPFCPETLSKYHRKEILRATQRWVVTESQWPYKNIRIHLLAILRRHAENLTDLSRKDFQELFEILTWAQMTYQIAGGAFCMRFGDTSLSGGSVAHLHVHIISPDRSQPEYVPIRFKIG